jgi:hypothetical protein
MLSITLSCKSKIKLNKRNMAGLYATFLPDILSYINSNYTIGQ